MSYEWGVFNDEGCVERGLWSREQAERVAREDYEADDEVSAAMLCPDHEEQQADGCEECMAEDDDE